MRFEPVFGASLRGPKYAILSESQTASQPALEQCFLQGRFPERNNGTSEGLKQLEKFIGLAKPLDPTGKRYPKLLVAETNTPHEKQRPEWFTAVCTRMHRYGSNSVGVLTY